jgi:SHS2 domain-containing protein
LETGHRLLPHTADIRVEAWGVTRATCLAELVAGIVDSFVDRTGTDSLPSTVVPVEHHGGNDRDLAVWLVEEVLWLLDTDGVVPVAVDLTDNGNGLHGDLHVVSGDLVEVIGSAPKAVSYSDLIVEQTDQGWHSVATIDV